MRKTRSEVKENSRKMLTLEDWKALADEVFDAGTLYLLLTGGEPFLWKDFHELYEYLARKGFVLSINSNGSILNEEIIRWLRKNPPSRINITLYGASNETYERFCGVRNMFDKVARNVDLLIECGIPVKINASMTPDNVQDMEAIIRFAKSRDLILEMTTYMFPPVRRGQNSANEFHRFTPNEAAKYLIKKQKLMLSDQEYQSYIQRIKHESCIPLGLTEKEGNVEDQVSCQAGRGSYWITWDGMMLPCGMLPDICSDVAELGFSEAWNKVVENTANIRLNNLCSKCGNRFICHGCAAMFYAENGSFDQVPRYLCEMAEAVRQTVMEGAPITNT